MGEQFDDCEFWLPPEFLCEDDFMMDLKKNEMGNIFLSDAHKRLSSPGESLVSITDSESDEDDYVSGLTRKMVHSTLDEDEAHAYGNNKVWGLSGSPKSPLCSGLVGYGGKQGFRATAEEAGRKKMVEEIDGLFQSNNKSFAPLQQSSSNFGFNPTTSQLSYQQFQAARFELLKRDQMLKEQRQGGGVYVEENGGCGEFYQVKLNQQLAQSRQQNGGRRQVGLSNSAWPTLQQSQQPGSGMRAIFLGNSGTTKERTGTGVFLPRRIGSNESRKNKQGCSTVLLPDRVVRALNLNLESLNAKPQVHPGNIGSFVAYDAALKYGKKNENIGKQRQSRENSTRSQALADEVQLPPEWIY
ncbi:hypothetical protein LIER_03055 [Lithospermum erythrorhizon]|uniref:Uncharacterized protein n=1 Tax=Lithospermum erythrorhizon TaxID=34254 RepID=A0AAV3NRS3_LITER